MPTVNASISDHHARSPKWPLEGFVAELRRLPEAAFADAERMLSFLAHNPVDPASLEPCLLWDRQHHTRNLIDRTELYELIAICWEIGQASAIHDHDGQQCWMAVPIGRILIENFLVLGNDLNSCQCRIEKADAVEMHSEMPQVVDPESPVHRVSNPRKFNQRAVSLHIYSRPIEKCVVYSEEKQSCGVIALSYTSTPESRTSAGNRGTL